MSCSIAGPMSGISSRMSRKNWEKSDPRFYAAAVLGAMGRIVGIDLGTTNSLVAYIDPKTNQPRCIPGPYGSTLCPSVVSLDADGTIIVGEAARSRLLTQPERTIYSVKRLMGRGPADVQGELRLFPFRIDPASKNVIRVMLG